MNISVDPWISSEILGQLHRVNARCHAPDTYVADFAKAREKSLIFEVEAGHLKKQVEELHNQVLEKEERLVAVEEKAGKIAQAEKLENDLKKMQEENAALKSGMAEVSRNMEALKSYSEKTAAEKEQAMVDLADAVNEIGKLKTKVETLEEDLETEKKARELAVSKYKENDRKAEEALTAIEKLEWDLRVASNDVGRLIEERVRVMEKANLLEAEVQKKREMLILWEKRLEEKEYKRTNIFPFFRRPQTAFAQTASSPVQPPSNNPVQETDFVKIEPHDFSPDQIPEVDARVLNYETRIPRADFKVSVTHEKCCTGVAFNPTNGSIVVTTSDDGSRTLWNPETRTVMKHLERVVEGGLLDVDFTYNGEHILAACRDGSVRMWGFRGAPARLTGHGQGVNCVACNPADTARAVSSGVDKNIIMWNLERGVQVEKQHVERNPLAVCHNREGNMLLSGHSDGKVVLWDVRSREFSAANTDMQVHRDGVTGLSFFPNENNLFLTAAKDEVKVLDLRMIGGLQEVEKYSCLGSLGTVGYFGQGSCTLGISPDGNFIVAGTMDGKLKVWNRKEEGHRQLTTLRSEHHRDSGGVVACAWSPTENRIVSCDKSGVVVFWEDVQDPPVFQ